MSQVDCGEVRDNDNSFQCDLCNNWNHAGCLNIVTEKFEKLKKIHYPGTVQIVQWKYLSRHCLIEV